MKYKAEFAVLTEQDGLLATVYDAAIELAHQARTHRDDPARDDGALYAGLAKTLYELTESPDDVRLICSDALTLYDEAELKRRYEAVDEFFEDKQYAITEELDAQVA